MPLQIVVGKPGSGKSYHTVTLLLKYLEDWAMFERKEGEPFDRVLYTNLPLQIDAINAYLAKKMAYDDVDISHYIQPIDENVRLRFAESGGKFPLAMLPQNSMIVIDEVQKMFGAEMDSDRKNKAFQVEFRNYITTHRHLGHDLIFITQSTDNISKAILSQAEKLYDIENAKNSSLKFPINIPLADIDIVKEAFGIKGQFYRCKVGKYTGRRVNKKEGEVTSHVMTKEVFACYNSYTLSDITSDRPSLRLSRRAAIWWIFKRHAWHLALKLIVALFVLFWAIYFMKNFPTLLSNGLSSAITPASAKTPHTPPAPEKTTVPQMTPPRPAPLSSQRSNVRPLPGNTGCTDPHCTHDHSLPPTPPPKSSERITAIFPLGVITDNGRRKIGQTVMIEGTEETIKVTNVRLGVVTFESGKKITVPK